MRIFFSPRLRGLADGQEGCLYEDFSKMKKSQEEKFDCWMCICAKMQFSSIQQNVSLEYSGNPLLDPIVLPGASGLMLGMTEILRGE